MSRAMAGSWSISTIDAGISAKKGSQRPAFEHLMRDAQSGKFDVVVVDKIDRFYRHLSGLLSSLDQLNSVWGFFCVCSGAA